MLGFWLEGNLDTYPFIDAPYFEDNLTCVKSPFPEAHMIAAKDAGIILGFIDLIKSSIEGLFVGLAYRKKGRGKALIDAVKNEGSSKPHLFLYAKKRCRGRIKRVFFLKS